MRVYMCSCVMACVCYGTLVRVSSLWEGTWLIRLGGKHLRSLSHLTGPVHAILMKVQMFRFSVLEFS